MVALAVSASLRRLPTGNRRHTVRCHRSTPQAVRKNKKRNEKKQPIAGMGCVDAGPLGGSAALMEKGGINAALYGGS
ncbi:hypothetical protein [Isoalcanivorax beigongshangi]|uniref:Uncharacterized protein n=1 Tax=Isoalcanivorax beigongshangi TaxID=3238810 RepID=A0ABV4AHU0_9GAMM